MNTKDKSKQGQFATGIVAFLKSLKYGAGISLLSFSVTCHAGNSNTSLAMNSLPGSDQNGQTQSDAGKSVRLNLAPEDLNARGVELENTFYEIDGPAPYSNAPTFHETNTDMPAQESSILPQKMTSTRWSIWAASAAGIVGLGTIGYLTLSDDGSKTPRKNVTVIVDK